MYELARVALPDAGEVHRNCGYRFARRKAVQVERVHDPSIERVERIGLLRFIRRTLLRAQTATESRCRIRRGPWCTTAAFRMEPSSAGRARSRAISSTRTSRPHPDNR